MSQPNTLTTWLEYISAQHPRAIDMGLERIRNVLTRMRIQTEDLGRVITVAGTNGKGTTVAALEAMLLAQGFDVAVYTSPHILRYNERVRCNGRDLDDADLCRGFTAVEAARGETHLTYFEYGTLAALHEFAQRQPDFSILEVGLGGRLDAVNIIDADVAIITTVDIDHVEWLGPDRETIGKEKAGILRQGKIFVCADRQPPTSVRHEAERLNVQAYWAGRDFGVTTSTVESHWNWFGQGSAGQPLSLIDLNAPLIPMPNLAAAMQALAALDLLPSAEVLNRTAVNIQVPGRMQRLLSTPEVLVDVGHNPQAARYLCRQIRTRGGRWRAVFSALADKDLVQVIAALATDIGEWYCGPLVADRAAGRDQLQAAFEQNGISAVRWFDGVGAALQAAIAESAADEHILVFGSFYTVAEATQEITQQ